ncbi:MAG: riboflavin synthase [Varibaculum sp.]|nr:riboflavin synthase [Varibaculum sp.]
MFTGLIENLGTITETENSDEVRKITVECGYNPETGESIAVNGVCLTVVDALPGAFSAELMPETLRLTTLNALKVGDTVNLERALRVGDRLGGHNVQGHVDAIATVAEVVERERTRDVRFQVMPAVAANCVLKGSVAIDGISLTISGRGADWVSVALIPETLERTIAQRWQVGGTVNIEADIFVKTLRQTLDEVLPQLLEREQR